MPFHKLSETGKVVIAARIGGSHFGIGIQNDRKRQGLGEIS